MNTKKWYDTKEGITAKLDTLENFHKLLDERRIAHRERSENLDTFYVLNGFYCLDTFGQCWKNYGSHIQKIIFLPVVTKQELWMLIKNYDAGRNALTNEEIRADFKKAEASGRPWPTELSASINCPPMSHILCPECGKGWDMSNVTDYLHKESVRKRFPVGEFVGKTLKEMWSVFEKRTDMEYYAPTDHRVSNPKYIDKTPHPEHSTLSINGNGFTPDDMGVTDPDRILEEGDVVEFWAQEYFHRQCLRTHLDSKEKEGFMKIFNDAGFQQYDLQPISNEYEGCHDPDCTKCASWFIVITEVGIFKIGWRKRVIDITWPEKKKLLHLFMDQNTTKNDSGIHAWSWEKATEYLKKIHEELSTVKVWYYIC